MCVFLFSNKIKPFILDWVSLILFFHPLIDHSIQVLIALCVSICFCCSFVFRIYCFCFASNFHLVNLTIWGDIVASFYGGIQMVFCLFLFLLSFPHSIIVTKLYNQMGLKRDSFALCALTIALTTFARGNLLLYIFFSVTIHFNL